MSPKIYLLLAVAAAIGLVITFGIFVNSKISGSFFEETTVSGILLTIGIFVIGITVLMPLMALSLMKYLSSRNAPVRAPPTKKCPSCGTEMDEKEMSCPRCFTLQPVGGHGPHRR